MKPAKPGEYCGLVVAALILLLVLIACFMCIQLYNERKPTPLCPRGRGSGEGFLENAYYAPGCGSDWGGLRRESCRGLTSGVMPSIDVTSGFGNGLCCGRLGIPP